MKFFFVHVNVNGNWAAVIKLTQNFGEKVTNLEKKMFIKVVMATLSINQTIHEQISRSVMYLRGLFTVSFIRAFQISEDMGVIYTTLHWEQAWLREKSPERRFYSRENSYYRTAPKNWQHFSILLFRKNGKTGLTKWLTCMS